MLPCFDGYCWVFDKICYQTYAMFSSANSWGWTNTETASGFHALMLVFLVLLSWSTSWLCPLLGIGLFVSVIQHGLVPVPSSYDPQFRLYPLPISLPDNSVIVLLHRWSACLAMCPAQLHVSSIVIRDVYILVSLRISTSGILSREVNFKDKFKNWIFDSNRETMLASPTVRTAITTLVRKN